MTADIDTLLGRADEANFAVSSKRPTWPELSDQSNQRGIPSEDSTEARPSTRKLLKFDSTTSSSTIVLTITD